MWYIAPAPAAAETLKFRFWIRVSAAVNQQATSKASGALHGKQASLT